MFELKQTETFREWWTRLKDERARGLITSRLNRLAYGHTGDVAPVGEGISELRIHFGPGYPRIFSEARQDNRHSAVWWRQEQPSQAKDIRKAKKLAEVWSD